MSLSARRHGHQSNGVRTGTAVEVKKKNQTNLKDEIKINQTKQQQKKQQNNKFEKKSNE